MMYSRDGGCDTKSKATIGTGRRHKRVLSSLVDASQIEHRARVDHKLDELNKYAFASFFQGLKQQQHKQPKR